MSNRVAKIVKNTSALTLAKMLRPFLSIWLIAYISRVLGTSGLGRYTAIFSYLAVFEILSNYGLNTVLARDVAQNKAQGLKYLHHGMIMLLPISLVTLAAMNGWMWVLGKDALFLQAAFWASLSLVATAMNNCSEGVLMGLEEMHVVGWVWAVENFVRVVVSVTLIRLGYGLVPVVVVYVVLRFLMSGYYYYHIQKLFSGSAFAWDRSFLWHLFKTSRTFVLIMIFVTLYWKADVLMLDNMLGEEAVGFYNGGYRFYDIIHVVIGSFVLSIFPVLSEFHKTDKHAFVYTSRKALKYFVILGLPVVILLGFWAKPLVLLVMGPEQLPSVKVLMILSIAIIPYGIGEIFAYMLVASANQKIDLLVNGVAMVCNVIFNYFLIQRYQYNGAAVATVASIVLFLLVRIAFVQRRLMPLMQTSLFKLVGVLVPAGALMAALSAWLVSWHLLVLSPLTVILYLALVWRSGLVSFEDKQIIGTLFAKFSKKRAAG